MIEVTVKAGDYPIGNLIISRLRGGNSYDDINTYTCSLRLHNVDKYPLTAQFLHRYGDEWPMLVSRALEAIGTNACEDHRDKQPSMVRK